MVVIEEKIDTKDTEQIVLSCILKEPQLIYEIDLNKSSFNYKHHKGLFAVLQSLSERKNMSGSEFEPYIIIDYAEKNQEIKMAFKKTFDNLEGRTKKNVINFVDMLNGMEINPDNVDLFIENLKKANAINEVIDKNKYLAENLLKNYGDMTLNEVLDKCESTILEISNKYVSVGSDVQKIGEGIVNEYRNRKPRKKKFIGFPTIFKKIDKKTGGLLRRGSVLVVNSRTGVGKSLVLKSIVKKIGVDMGEPVYFGANEQNIREQKDRIIAEVADVDPEVIENGLYNLKGNEDMKKEVLRAARKVEDAPIFIERIRGYTPRTLVQRARYFKKRHQIKGFVWDYVKRSSAYRKSNRELRHWLGDVVNLMKEEIADPLDIFVATASQAKTYEPWFSAESYDIERHCTAFMVLRKLKQEEKEEKATLADYGVTIKKNRFGWEHTNFKKDFFPVKFDERNLLFKEE